MKARGQISDPFRYGFSTNWPNPQDWKPSAQVFDDLDDAVAAMGDWAKVCALNGLIVGVKLRWVDRKS